jgi:hypothetical protein
MRLDNASGSEFLAGIPTALALRIFLSHSAELQILCTFSHFIQKGPEMFIHFSRSLSKQKLRDPCLMALVFVCIYRAAMIILMTELKYSSSNLVCCVVSPGTLFSDF